jgi:hypothetical protein
MPAIPSGYDPVLLNHFLWYKYHCSECSPSEFQILFEKIVKRVDSKFMSVRPYGPIGDRKCDGLLFAEGASTVFQVYAPDELKQDELIRKINEDLDGAILHWSESLQCWIFVYNVRRGVPPDVARLLVDKQKTYPTVDIDHWSSDTLWEKVRALPLQQRAEILGAPNGYEHLFFSTHTTAAEIKQHLDSGSFVLVQDLDAPISLRAVSEAMAPAAPFGAPFFIRPTYVRDALPWTDAAQQQQHMVREVLEKGRELVPRFSVFSLAPIPLAAHLGFLLSDRVEVNYFQFDRDAQTWKWPTGKRVKADTNIIMSDLPGSVINDPVEVALSIGLSAPVAKIDVQEAAPNCASHIAISVAEPDVMWLRSPSQLQKLTQVLRHAQTAIRAKVPRCTGIHVFYAEPTGGAIILGQTINPRMNPPVHLYQYSQQTSPRYQHALTLTETLSL